MLDGMFSFILLDNSVTPSRIIAARDPIGITTLYQGHHSSAPETIYFASELKALSEECDVIRAFPPGCVYDSATGETVRYFKPTWFEGDSGKEGAIPTGEVDYKLLRETLEMAVKKRLMSEVPYGVLLSGGLDSSLIASIAARETDKLANEQHRKREERMKLIAEGGSGAKTPNGPPDGECYPVQLTGKHLPAIGTSLTDKGVDISQTPTPSSLPGRNSTPLLSVYQVLPTSSPREKPPPSSVLLIMSILSPSRRVWMRLRMSFTIWRPTMSRLFEPRLPCTS